jgi:hypothetical protein|tara:strand:+ start:191 stop:385 length:195 start_codon:yes stop_codon:yes gene_type:complete
MNVSNARLERIIIHHPSARAHPMRAMNVHMHGMDNEDEGARWDDGVNGAMAWGPMTRRERRVVG